MKKSLLVAFSVDNFMREQKLHCEAIRLLDEAKITKVCKIFAAGFAGIMDVWISVQ